MKVTYHTPETLAQMLRDQNTVTDKLLADAEAANNVGWQLFQALTESYERVRMGLPVGVTVDEPDNG